MTETDRVEACARLLRAAAIEAGMAMSGDGRVGEADAAQLLGLSAGGLRNMRQEGDAPPAFRVAINGARISYRLGDLAQWIEARRFA